MHYLHPDGASYARDECPMDQAHRRGASMSEHEDVFVRPDGTFYNVRCNVVQIVRDGERVGAIIDIRDVTRERAAERALRESEENLRSAAELKDQFLGLVSHELRTPISTILGNGMLLLRRGDQVPADDRQQALSDIVSEADKLQEIIENLLLLTRLEAGRLELEPLSLPQLVDNAVREFKRLHPERRISVTVQPGLAVALGQDTFVLLVLRNLLSNAEKYSAGDSGIEVVLRNHEDGEPEVSVRDHGIGLDEADLVNIFRPFYRSRRAKGQAKGIGLGLAVCKRVMEAQGGSIGVEPYPGEGTEFYFRLASAGNAVPI
jgi:signal transduction histidine kinase